MTETPETQRSLRGNASPTKRVAPRPATLPFDARAGHLLRRAYHMAREQARTLLRDLDVTPRQSAALQAISNRGSLSQQDIGEAIGMEPANVHGLVDRLKKKQLIVAARDPANPRRMRVRLTAAGEAMIAELEAIAHRGEETALAKLSEAERAQLVGLLRKLVE
ncbi:MAG: MarR family winged helix-turn-helix transcriptional regulator [Beijerinckiaceae bacterium]